MICRICQKEITTERGFHTHMRMHIRNGEVIRRVDWLVKRGTDHRGKKLVRYQGATGTAYAGSIYGWTK